MIVREMPYTNLHDLNIDWILKIVKDFQGRYQNLDETFQSMLEQITTAGTNAVEAINNNEETALEAIRVFLEQCIQAIDSETNTKIEEIGTAGTNQIGLIDQEATSKLGEISNAGAAQVNIINGLITTLPQTYEDSVNQLQIINAVLNQTYNYPPLVQGHYADQEADNSQTLVADNYRVSTLLSSGCASKKIKIQVTNVAGIIRDIIYWTGWGSGAVAHTVPVSTSASDEKTLYTYTFPATATYFTIVFAYDYNMGTQLLVSDLQVSLQWQFTALESIEMYEHGFDVSNTNALEFVIPGNTNLTIEEGSEIDEIDVAGGSKSVATSHKLKDSTARESINVLNSATEAIDENFKELLEYQFIKYQPVNFFPQLSSSNLTSNKYLQNGSEISSELYSYTDYIEIEGNTQYCLGLVPAYGGASTPWYQCPVGMEFYDINKTFISNITPTTAFTSPYGAHYVRVNVATGSINLLVINQSTMLVKGDSLPQDYTPGGGVSEYYNLPQVSNDVSDLNSLKSTNYIRLIGINESGIILIRNGTTIYNTGSHATYDVSNLVGKTLYITGKSNAAGDDGKAYVLYGFYDANNTLLDYHESTSNTEYTNVSVTVPNNATKLIVNGLELNTFYYPSAYTNIILPAPSPIAYSLTNDIITITSKYSDSVAIFEFGKRGPNNLPDFRYITVDERIKYNNSTDWCGPYIVKAVNNGDGDDINTHTFTGGNHNYANTGAMNSTATGRNLSLKYYADGKELTNGDIGTASIIEIAWVNRIQAYNTRKSDGNGREVLEEKHLFRFDGYEWMSKVEITPLEDIYIETYYGFQCAVTYYPTIHMIGADYRLPFNYSDPHSSGNSTPNMYVGVSEYDRLEMEVDRSFDLGKGNFYNGTEGFRTYNGGKGYSYLILNQNMYKDCSYGARGYYRFLPI